jgi:hypothetical protein
MTAPDGAIIQMPPELCKDSGRPFLSLVGHRRAIPSGLLIIFHF